MWCSTRSRADALATAGATALAACLSLGLLLAAPVSANTGESTATSNPRPSASMAQAHPQLPGSRLQGQATLRYFGLRVYHAQLWTLPDFRASEPAEQPLVLELEYLRDLKGQAIAERSLQEMRRAGPIAEAQGQRWLAEMQRVFPDVKAGDRITGQHLPGQGARFWHNGQPAGKVDDALFAQRFFGIWLASSTSEPDMRLALLGMAASGARR